MAKSISYVGFIGLDIFSAENNKSTFGTNPYKTFIFSIGYTRSSRPLGGAHPYIELKWPIMALLNPEHMTVQGINP